MFSMAVSFAALASPLVDVTEAVLVMVPLVPASAMTSITTSTDPPVVIVPSEQVTVPAASEHVP